VLFAGNIGVAQDFPTVLAAAKQLQAYSDIHFVILGDGRQKAAVLDQIQSEGLTQVHLLGRFPETQMPQFFALADVLLVSLADEPIFAVTIPSKVQSYLACAKPIVAALNGEGATVGHAFTSISINGQRTTCSRPPCRCADFLSEQNTRLRAIAPRP
jgi:glycosyltransferase involved in cell wall biosynthesis